MKKMMRWVLAFVTCLLLFSMGVSAESYKAGGGCGSDLKWSLDYNGNLFIYGEGQMADYGTWDHNTKGWEEYTSEIKKITVEKGATSIGRRAFSDCTNLTTVKLPSTIDVIESDAFAGCTSLSKINLPVGLLELGSGTFSDCISLTSITLPKTLTNLGDRGWGLNTFSGTGLKSITIPSSVKKMAGYCFTGCPNLTTVTINGNNLEVGYEAFMDCPKLTTVKMGSGVSSLVAEAFRNCTSLRNVTIGENVTFIGGQAFRNCTSLKEIVIPDKVTTLWCDAFKDCTALEKVTLGVGLSSIEDYAFLNCVSLKTVYFCGAAPAFTGTHTFEGCKRFTAYYPKKSKTWDRSNLTAHGAERIDWKEWTTPLGHYTPVLKSVTVGAKGLTLKWNKLSGATGYEVWRKTGNGNWTRIKKISKASTLTWTDTKVSNGTRYTYRICGTKGSQTSKVSNSQYMYYLTRNTVTLSKNGTSVLVKWKKNSSATGYEIQYGRKSSFSGSRTKLVKGTRKVSQKITPGFKGKCYFRVRTYKTVNGVTSYSAWSAARSVTL